MNGRVWRLIVVEKYEKLFLFALLALGLMLRILWPHDMEWKQDEQKNYEIARQAADTGNWPKVGILNSQGIPNPPLNAWVFTVFAKATRTPLGMVRCVQWLNVISVLLYLLLFLQIFKKKQDIILRGMTLFAVSPMPIIYSRKIWQQCLLPLFNVPVFLPVLFPTSAIAYFIAGMFLSFSVQIHQSGLFFFPFLVLLFAWRFKERLKTRYVAAFVSGGALGLLAMIPWVEYIRENGIHSTPSSAFDFSFVEYAARDLFGLGTKYMLQGEAWRGFIQIPMVFGSHVLLVGAFAAWAWFAIQWVKNFPLQDKRVFLGVTSVVLYAFSLFVLKIRFYPHYLIVLYPWLHFAVPALLTSKKWLVHLVILCSLMVSWSFLRYIHVTGGMPNTEYGQTWRVQMK